LREQRKSIVSGNDYEIRLAQDEELPLLNEIERAAAAIFRSAGLDSVAEMEPLSLDLLQTQQSKGQVWVVAGADGTPVGFAVATIVDEAVHLEEVSVHPKHSRRGLGTRLVQAVCDWADEKGYPAVTLSTFRDVSWNAPFYARIGFRAMAEEELGPGLQAVRAHETEDGLNMQQRVFMRRDVGERKGMIYFDLDALPERMSVSGMRVKVVCGERAMMTFVDLYAGASTPEHSHATEQIGYVISGEVTYDIGGVRRTCRAGDVYLIPENTPHSVKVSQDGPARLLDVFSPPREEYK
jgi:quercetin dioxygenase-like cupin family protein/predicted N-acetyltransferase YhbS